MTMPHEGPTAERMSTGEKVAANLAYVIVALAIAAIAMAIAAAAGGLTSWALIAAGVAVILVAVGGTLWLRQAAQKRRLHSETNDRAESTEGKGPLDL
jgi:membrane protein YdbS with pleckstrin-like domain